MAGIKLDFTGIPEYQPNNLHLCSMGNVTDRAIHSIWKDIPMSGTERPYMPLGYIARNGLGEELMYCAYIGTTAIAAAGSPVNIIIPIVPTGTVLQRANLYTFTAVTGTITPALKLTMNGVVFYAYAAASTASPRYGWVRLLFGMQN